MSIKTVILTHPCLSNYGGCLQSYSLQYVIKSSLGKDNCYVFTYTPKDIRPIIYNWNIRINSAIISFLRVMGIKLTQFPVSMLSMLNIGRKFASCMPTVRLSIKDNETFKKSSDYLKRIIVGSDQVWRVSACRSMAYTSMFFLSGVNEEIRRHSFSYAASFGTDEWEGTLEETEECGRLLREFKAVSVREHSGIKICKEVFGVDAVQMPDPTLLLHTVDYGKIIDSEKTWQPKSRYVAAYVLDETAGKAELLQEGASALNLQLQHLMPHANAKKRRDRFPISVPQWLRLIRDCEYFITDSFHGCVFAIIYNKPFVCLGNEGRGNARFDTLLGTFGLEDRLITDATPEKLLQVLNAPIDWERVNAIHDSERERGINFLKENLSES